MRTETHFDHQDWLEVRLVDFLQSGSGTLRFSWDEAPVMPTLPPDLPLPEAIDVWARETRQDLAVQGGVSVGMVEWEGPPGATVDWQWARAGGLPEGISRIGFGFNEDERLVFPNVKWGNLSVADVARAGAIGLAPSHRRVLLVRGPASQVGGFSSYDIIAFFAGLGAEVIVTALLARTATAVGRTVNKAQYAPYQALADVWRFERGLAFPAELRDFIDGLEAPDPISLGRWLELPSQAAETLLTSLGYEMDRYGSGWVLSSTPQAESNRALWLANEREHFVQPPFTYYSPR